MKRFFLRFSSVLLFLLTSCGDEKDAQMKSSFDSLKAAIDTVSHEDTLSLRSAFDKIILDYSKQYNAVSDFYSFKKSNSSVQSLKSKYILFPVFSYQIDFIMQDASSDTVLTYFTDNSSAFVLNVGGGIDKIKKLDKAKNGIILFKTKDAEVSPKLYLIKRYRDFQHKERKVTEFYLSGDVIEAFSINTPEKILLEKFKLIQ